MCTAEPWLQPPTHPALAEDAVHVWCASLWRPAAEYQALWPLLAADEQARAKRFYFERDRNHYVAARGWLRTLIGRYLRVAPQAVQFTYGDHGKPALSGRMTPRLTFNLSHTHGVALAAFGWEREIGVDVERVRQLADAAHIARSVFSAWEMAEFTAVPQEQQLQAFFNCWTRKEAFIKAIGDGLSYPLDTFDVTLKPGDPPRLWRIRGSREMAARWTLHALAPLPGYVGAVIAQGKDWHLARFRWPDADPGE